MVIQSFFFHGSQEGWESEKEKEEREKEEREWKWKGGKKEKEGERLSVGKELFENTQIEPHCFLWSFKHLQGQILLLVHAWLLLFGFLNPEAVIVII